MVLDDLQQVTENQAALFAVAIYKLQFTHCKF